MIMMIIIIITMTVTMNALYMGDDGRMYCRIYTYRLYSLNDAVLFGTHTCMDSRQRMTLYGH